MDCSSVSASTAAAAAADAADNASSAWTRTAFVIHLWMVNLAGVGVADICTPPLDRS